MTKAVVGVFTNEERAKEAINELKRQGFEREISLVAKETSEGQGGTAEQEMTMEEGQNLGDGVATGGALGGVAGILAGAGALFIPGVGPIIAAGPLASFLTGLVGGGLVGGLVDFGIPEERGQYYEERVKQGDLLVTIKANEEEVSQVSRVFRQHGAEEVESH